MEGSVPGNFNVPLKQILAGTNARTQLKLNSHCGLFIYALHLFTLTVDYKANSNVMLAVILATHKRRRPDSTI